MVISVHPSEKYGVGGYSNSGQFGQIMRYINDDGSWYIGKMDETFGWENRYLLWTKVGDTRGTGSTNEFGDLLDDHHILMLHTRRYGDYDGDSRSDILFHFTGDTNWFLGRIEGVTPTNPLGSLKWHLVDRTYPRFGNLYDGRHLIVFDKWHPGHNGILFYYVNDGNWHLGEIISPQNLQLRWSKVGNTHTFGNILTSTHLIIAGSFIEHNVGSLLMYYEGSGNWHLGWIEGSTLGTSVIKWHHVVHNWFGNLRDGNHLNMKGYFGGNSKDDILFYNATDGNWWFGWIEGWGTSSSTPFIMKWKNVGNTGVPGFGRLTDGYHLNVSGDFDGDSRDEILMYSSSDGDWWLIKINGNSFSTYILSAQKIGNTKGTTGNLADPFHDVVSSDILRGNGAPGRVELLAIRYPYFVVTRKVWHITVPYYWNPPQLEIKELPETF